MCNDASTNSKPAPIPMWCRHCDNQIQNWKEECPHCGHAHSGFSDVVTLRNPSEALQRQMDAESAQRDALRKAAIGRLKSHLSRLEALGAAGIFVPGRFSKLFKKERYHYHYKYIDGELLLFNGTLPTAGGRGLTSGAIIGLVKLSEERYTEFGVTPDVFGISGIIDLKSQSVL